MYLSLDSLCRIFERKLQKPLPTFDYSHIKWQNDLISPDGDLEDALNVFFQINSHKMPYPDITNIDTSGKYRPSFLVVSDSYWMGVYYLGLPEKIFRDHNFWYYNKQIFCYGKSDENKNPSDLNLVEKIKDMEIIAIMASDAQLEDFGWNFIENLYSIYFPNDTCVSQIIFNNQVKALEKTIQNTPDWFNSVTNQAKELNISVDSCVRLNAIYMVNLEVEKKNQK
jgi:hypothetical protein